jgi:putative ABC transport system permease protein
MNGFTRGIRNAFRNVIRTVSLVIIIGLSIGLSLSMLVAHQAVGKKIDDVKSSVGNTVSVAPAGIRGFQGGGDALTVDELKSISKLSHVTGVVESLNDRLTSSNSNLVSAIDAGSFGNRSANNSGVQPKVEFHVEGNSGGGDTNVSFTPPVTVVGTTDPSNLNSSDSQGGGTFTLKSGKVFSAGSSENVAIVGSSLATKNNLKVGSTFTAYGATVKVVGIFDAGNTFSNNQVIMPLKTVQTLSSQPGAVTDATVTVDSITNVESVTSAVKKALGSKADVTNAAAEAENTVAPLENIQTISMYSLIGAAAAGAVIILLTMIMIVRERRREIGVLKAIGASNLRIMFQFIAESITLTLLGAVIGIALGVAAGSPITNMLVSQSSDSNDGPSLSVGGGPRMAVRGLGGAVSNIHAAVGWSIILYGLATAIIIAIVGSSVASFFIAKIKPAEVMRAE